MATTHDVQSEKQERRDTDNREDTTHPLSIVEMHLESPSSQHDLAATILPSHSQIVDPALSRRVRRKIDLVFIPLMWFGYGFVYYDKVFHPIFFYGYFVEIFLFIVYRRQRRPLRHDQRPISLSRRQINEPPDNLNHPP